MKTFHFTKKYRISAACGDFIQLQLSKTRVQKNWRLLFYLLSVKITIVQNTILRVLEAWALELLRVSHIGMRESILRKKWFVPTNDYAAILYISDIDGEAYPKTESYPLIYRQAIIRRI